VRKDLTDRKVTVTVPGGDLHIEWTDRDRMMMTGPAEYEFSGMLNPLTGEFSVDGA
jgi:diaminopimelate epimerase